jgi:hypothetical protein
MNAFGPFLYSIVLPVDSILLRRMNINFSGHKIDTKGID